MTSLQLRSSIPNLDVILAAESESKESFAHHVRILSYLWF